jgi:hypothetical protein
MELVNFVDIAVESINKYGEELCGDKVEIVRSKDSIIIVVSDGLGSGVKANILASLTSKIAATMLKEGASIYETVDTIVNTLPTCKIRKLAYSTFTIIKVYFDGRVYVAEYDNPPFFLFKKDESSVEKETMIINGKAIRESNFILLHDEVLTVVSDGAVHAGVGAVLNLGWKWDNINSYLKDLVFKEKSAKNISKSLIEVCECLYAGHPGDDTTVVVVKMKKPQIVSLFTGPPKDREKDKLIIEKFMSEEGKKIVCGGTAANIAARELGEEISVNMEFIDPEVPPTAFIKGIDLVSEGVLTIRKALDKIRYYASNSSFDKRLHNLNGRDGASMLAKILIEECSHIKIFAGMAVNPAHQNPDFPTDLCIKSKLVKELAELMRYLGKDVELTYM